MLTPDHFIYSRNVKTRKLTWPYFLFPNIILLEKFAMIKKPFFSLNKDPDALRGFYRTVAEIEWLLLLLMMFYLVVGQIDEDFKIFLLGGLCAYAAFVMVFH